ncbi:MAG: carboxypeptidase regulatory-like domain-containing protein [Candidatus Cloacimonadaceae bacterium]|nr:carboxypeptidase regulatory-like domain-containing protein [Candidatus Cloacimonadaceae bacterium]MDP3113385.1 carboxypeptidase regulatory-like domain-containing protein [Candidatus Cloacimonadaceae bacterium]
MRSLALILLIVVLVSIAVLDASTTGKLAVRVRDGQGKALEFVNVSVMHGTQRITGGQTNNKGTAIIINIPPGTYQVRFSLVGYDNLTFNDVRIHVGESANLAPVMNKIGIRLETTTVIADQDRVGKDRTDSSRQIEMSKISDVSVTSVAGIVALQAGVTNIGGELHIRGGRANEVNFTVDGMSVSDPVDGGSALQVDTDAISDMKVMTGGFPAEYGNAQSGVINIVTKDGDSYYSGKIEYNTDHLIGEGRNSDIIKFALGGPVFPYGADHLKDKFTFYLNGGGEWQDGRLKDYYIGDPNKDYILKDYLLNDVQLLEYEYDPYNPYEGRESILGIDMGNRNYNSYNVNFKSKYVFNPTQRMTFAVRGDRSFDYPFSYGWRYALHHYAISETNQRQYVGTYDHVFNSTMNLKVKASYFQKTSNSGPRGIDRNNYMAMFIDPANLPADYVDNVLMGDYGYRSVDDNSDGVYDIGFLPASFWTYRIASVEFPRSISGFNAPGSIYTNFVDDKTSTINARADFEWQVNDTHLAKSGLEIIRHVIEKNQLQNFLNIYEDRRQASLRRVFDMANFTPVYDSLGVITNIPSSLHYIYETDDGILLPIYKPEDYYRAALEASGKRDGYKADPWQVAYYVQDKMEWEGMIVNAGLRFDFWYLGKTYQVLQDDGNFRTVEFDKSDRSQMMISPRLGVSHPITDRDVLRFAYNYQNQLPQMQYIFTSKTPADANVSDQAITVGNPKLEPQITVTYEVGLSHQLSDDFVIDMTAYYKNLYNYVSTIKEKKPGEEQITWYRFISEDYGSARGIDVQLEKIMSNFNTWTVAYSLAWAQGNNSSTVIQDEMTNLREFPLDWDVRHNLSLNYTFRIGRGEEFFLPYSDVILPFDDFSANLNWSFASGAPYTPQSTVGNSFLDTNSKRKDFTNQANMRLAKGIALPNRMNMRVFLDVENLFKTKNVLAVYPKTGSPYEDGQVIADSATNYIYPEVAYVYGKAIRNPGFVNNHRGFTLGLSLNF